MSDLSLGTALGALSWLLAGRRYTGPIQMVNTRLRALAAQHAMLDYLDCGRHLLNKVRVWGWNVCAAAA